MQFERYASKILDTTVAQRREDGGAVLKTAQNTLQTSSTHALHQRKHAVRGSLVILAVPPALKHEGLTRLMYLTHPVQCSGVLRCVRTKRSPGALATGRYCGEPDGAPFGLRAANPSGVSDGDIGDLRCRPSDSRFWALA